MKERERERERERGKERQREREKEGVVFYFLYDISLSFVPPRSCDCVYVLGLGLQRYFPNASQDGLVC
jgi:hypothetical protein